MSESELTAFDKAEFAVQWALMEEEAWLRQRGSLSREEIGWALLRTKYLQWLQIWTPCLKQSHKNKQMREQERCRKAAEATRGSVQSPGPKSPKWLFEMGAASAATSNQTWPSPCDLQRELGRVCGRSMVCRSDKTIHTKSLTRLMSREGAAAVVGPGLEGEAVRKELFAEESEVSRRCEQRRCELID